MGDRARTGRLVAGAAIGAGSLLLAYKLAAGRRDGTADRHRATYPPLDVPKPVADGVWVVDSGPMSAMGLTLPLRMTVVRLGNGDLLLHSPTAFGDDLARALDALGTVRHLVAPNVAHWTFLADWQRAYPQATTWGAPGLRERGQVRRSAVHIDRDLADAAPEEWRAEIEQGIVAGGGGFREVFFFHRPSGTLLLTDLIENLDPAKLPPVSRALMQLARATDGRTAVYLRAAVRLGGEQAAASVRRLVALEPERVVFAHGGWFEDRGAERLRRAFDWLI